MPNRKSAIIDLEEILALGSQLAQLPDRNAYLDAVHQQLLRLVPADDVVWIQATDASGSHCVAVRGDPWVIDEDLSAGLTRWWPQHVTPCWFAANLSDRTPNRVSDLIAPRRWRENEVFHELKNAMAEHQLNIIMPPPARYRGWVLTRQRSDFSDAEVEIATVVAPVLAALGMMYDRLEPWQAAARSATNEVALTARELSVLSVLAEGLPASAIGRRLGISGRTVAKHLEHIYRKLDCNDRLVAVSRAHQFALLPPLHQGRSAGGC